MAGSVDLQKERQIISLRDDQIGPMDKRSIETHILDASNFLKDHPDQTLPDYAESMYKLCCANNLIDYSSNVFNSTWITVLSHLASCLNYDFNGDLAKVYIPQALDGELPNEDHLRLWNAIRNLNAYPIVLTAIFEHLKRRYQTIICISKDGNWSQSWKIFSDQVVKTLYSMQLPHDAVSYLLSELETSSRLDYIKGRAKELLVRIHDKDQIGEKDAEWIGELRNACTHANDLEIIWSIYENL